MGNSLSCGGNMRVNTKMVLFWSHESPHLGLEYLDPSINQINILHHSHSARSSGS